MRTDTDRLLSEILTLHPKEQRHIFMTLWRHSDGLNEGLSADDCIEIFATALKGSSDFDYELLAQTCTDYSIPTVNENFVLLPRQSYDRLFSDGLKGKIPDGTELDTGAITNLLRLKNVGDLAVILLDVAEEKQFSLCFGGKYIYE
ncbi:hypothetical protein [Neisseria iguanae]|uniref:Uncharacterized protein n=1 Tax=Neisseria iguanae TaxID=90242 RepID=A0A2P7U2R2_9NEIS|nr:hypothetical protein [Neisseria iguanae]PSJ81235.1 hypothetical protein C7N83_01430 [Neisseria iguanae]